MDKNTPAAKGWRTLFQGAVAAGLLAIVGVLQEAATDTTWHPEWLLPFGPILAAVLAVIQNTIEDRKN